MTDITSTHLEAAIIDQLAAGLYHDRPYAFVSVIADNSQWQLGIAVANEQGYNPINKFFETQAEARQWADGLNKHIGLKETAVCDIIGSTMRGRPVAVLPS